MEKVGRYEIVGELGRGAMGVVYRAIDPTIGRTVALKTTRLDLDEIGRDELVRRLRNEAHAAGQMNHPNIVTIHDAGEWDGLFYIAMEYLEGETLQSLMAEQHPISTEHIVEIAEQVAAGLDYAHAMSVVHRDIKPANIMITRQHVAKIMDFGISKSVGTLTRTGQVLGTPYYMSPEQVMGHAVDGRSDLFSFGVVLYEMATGARPFGGDTVATVIYKIINEVPPPPCELQPAVHPALSAVVTRCLQKKPENRYQTGAELAADLESFPILHSDKEPATRSSALQRTQSIAPAQAAAVALAQATASSSPAVHAGIEVADFPQGSKTVFPANWFRTNPRSIWFSAAALVLIILAALNALRHNRKTQEQLPGGASIVVNVPANLGKQGHREVIDKHELQKGRELDRSKVSSPPASSQKESSLQSRVAIYFTSNPAGASIRLDGQSAPMWVTPHTIPDIVPGMHRVEIAKEGYSPEIRDLEIGPRDKSYGVDLVPK